LHTLRISNKNNHKKKTIEINGCDTVEKKKVMDDLSDGLVSWLKSVGNR